MNNAMNDNDDDAICTPELLAEPDADDAPDIWRWPLILGVLSAAGLICALVGDDWYDVLSWCMLAFPLIVMTRAMCK
jgi:hypothetical protein